MILEPRDHRVLNPPLWVTGQKPSIRSTAGGFVMRRNAPFNSRLRMGMRLSIHTCIAWAKRTCPYSTMPASTAYRGRCTRVTTLFPLPRPILYYTFYQELLIEQAARWPFSGRAASRKQKLRRKSTLYSTVSAGDMSESVRLWAFQLDLLAGGNTVIWKAFQKPHRGPLSHILVQS